MPKLLENTSSNSVDPSSIDADDGTYYIPCFAGLDALIKSIEKVGMLNPPVVQQSESGVLVPVLGRRRLRAAVQLGISQLEVRLLSAKMPQDLCFTLAFWDNMAHRSLDQASTAMVVKRLLELFPRAVAAKDFLPALGVPPRGPRLERLCAVATLEEPVLEALAFGRISEKSAFTLAEFKPSERFAVFQATEKLGFNANKRSEVIENLFDLSICRKTSVIELLNREDAHELLAGDDLALPERAERFRRLVRTWKFPELVAREQDFRTWCKDLPGSPRLSVRAAASFETEQIALEIRADSKEHAESMIQAVKDYLR